MEDYSAYEEAAKRGVHERNRNKKYMNPLLRKRFSSQQRGNPFDYPETPDELELMVGWFFDRLRVIVTIENHTLKFDGARQIIDILQTACTHDIERVSFNNYKLIEVDNPVELTFSWWKGQWFIEDVGGPDDVLRLPEVLKRFSRIYRFDAKNYSYGDNDDVEVLKLNGGNND
jgi:hypothetical protein